MRNRKDKQTNRTSWAAGGGETAIHPETVPGISFSLIDDQEIIRAFLRSALEAVGYEVTEAILDLIVRSTGVPHNELTALLGDVILPTWYAFHSAVRR